MRGIVWYIEDDGAIASEVAESLEAVGFQARIFSDGLTVRAALAREAPDVLLLDWNLPDDAGPSLCRWARLHDEHLPIVMVTVRDDPEDIVAGLRNGADDYVTKPFAMEVLISRIEALLRRTDRCATACACGEILLDDGRHAVSLRGEPVELSPLEYELLSLFLRNKGRIVTRDAIRAAIWGAEGGSASDNTITVAIKRLRAKLGDGCCLKTIRSFGYRLEDPR